ncbi:hypothetical protein EBR57_11085 [bacterium]|nr:hypothetical protein [bacterium]
MSRENPEKSGFFLFLIYKKFFMVRDLLRPRLQQMVCQTPEIFLFYFFQKSTISLLPDRRSADIIGASDEQHNPSTRNSK